MSNILDLFDQTFSSLERATGVLGLLQCVWVYDRAIDIDGLRRFHRHLQRGRLSRRIERSPLPFGRHRWVSPGGQHDLEIVATPRPREEFDAWLSEQAATPPGCRARTRMAPRGAPVHRRRRGGEPGHLALPHRRHRAVRGVDGTRRPAAPIRSAGPPPHHAGGGRHCARTPARPRATSRVSAAPSSLRHDSHGATAAVPPRPDWPVRRPRRPPEPDRPITLPTETIFVDADEWDARARSTRGDQQHPSGGPGGPAGPARGTGHHRRFGHRGDTRQRAHRR